LGGERERELEKELSLEFSLDKDKRPYKKQGKTKQDDDETRVDNNNKQKTEEHPRAELASATRRDETRQPTSNKQASGKSMWQQQKLKPDYLTILRHTYRQQQGKSKLKGQKRKSEKKIKTKN
jgi:hypothetical protein